MQHLSKYYKLFFTIFMNYFAEEANENLIIWLIILN